VSRSPFTASLLVVAVAVAACTPKADLVIQGGSVWTGLSTGRGVPGTVAIANGKILAVGDSAEVARYVGARTQVLRADGGLVVPGLADGHTHFIDGGFQLASVDLRDAATPEEFIRRLKDYAATLQPGEWITGGDWDHELWRGTPLPQRDWIDSVTPNNPVFVNRLDGHMALANGAALRAAGVTRATATPSGGEVVRDPTGEPLGVFKDQAMDLVWRAFPEPSPEKRDSALARAMAHAASLGVTATAHMSASWADWAAYRRMQQAGRMTLRVAVYLPLDQWHAVADTVRRAGQGDDWVRIGGVKGYMDGSAGSRTAFFFEPFSDSAGYSGLMQHTENEMRTWIGAADSAGLQIAVHAIGDRANALLLAIFDSVARAHGTRDRRFRDEHAQHLRPQEIPLFGAQRVVPSMQPYHAIDDGRWLQKRIGPVRIRSTYAFRSLIGADAPLAFGSDWTVAPLDPLLGVHAAVTRGVTMTEALRCYTVNNAYAMFRENEIGRIAPGLLADIVVLSDDLFTIAPERIAGVKVDFTIFDGKTIYERSH